MVEQNRAQQEPTRHEQRIYRLTLWTLVVLIVYAGFTLYAACQTAKAAKAAQEAVEVTRRTVEISQRAWVIANRMADMELVDGAAATVELKNVGRTPATYVFMQAQLMSTDGPFPEDPPYNKHIRTVGWHDAESLKTAVKVAINDIDSFQRSVDYPRIRELARKNRGRM